jgi:hypothetical protein
MVLYYLDPGPCREKLFQVATPARRVLARPVTADGGPIEDRFNSPSHPARCFRLGLPDPLQGFHHQRDIDRLHRQGTEYGLA